MSWLLEQAESFLFGSNQTPSGPAYSFLPLIGPALPVILIDVAYATFVLKIGPKFMESRKPYELKNVLKWYNVLQIISNFALSTMAIYHIIMEDDIHFDCVLQLPTNHRQKNIEVMLFYWGYMTKFMDYIDTILFVLRKSFRQVSFLHVYHHMMMTSCAYMYVRYYGFGGHFSMVGVVNAIVHAFMYSYYLASALHPGLKQSLWWKHYITKLQLVQFWFLVVHHSWPLFFSPGCSFPKIWLFLVIAQSSIMIVMFSDFYQRTYAKASKQDQQQRPNIDFIAMCNRNLSEDLKKAQ